MADRRSLDAPPDKPSQTIIKKNPARGRWPSLFWSNLGSDPGPAQGFTLLKGSFVQKITNHWDPSFNRLKVTKVFRKTN